MHYLRPRNGICSRASAAVFASVAFFFLAAHNLSWLLVFWYVPYQRRFFVNVSSSSTNTPPRPKTQCKAIDQNRSIRKEDLQFGTIWYRVYTWYTCAQSVASAIGVLTVSAVTNKLIRLPMLLLRSIVRWQDKIGDDFYVRAGTSHVASDHPQEEQEGWRDRRC